MLYLVFCLANQGLFALRLEGLTTFFAGFIFLHIINLLLHLIHQQLIKHKEDMFAHDFNIFFIPNIMDYLLKIIFQFITIVILFKHLGDDCAVSYVCH